MPSLHAAAYALKDCTENSTQMRYIYLDRLGGVLLLGDKRRLDLLGERLDLLGERLLRRLKLRLRSRSGLRALFFPLQEMTHVTYQSAGAVCWCHYG